MDLTVLPAWILLGLTPSRYATITGASLKDLLVTETLDSLHLLLSSLISVIAYFLRIRFKSFRR
jgi:hypothetical protein